MCLSVINKKQNTIQGWWCISLLKSLLAGFEDPGVDEEGPAAPEGTDDLSGVGTGMGAEDPVVAAAAAAAVQS